MMCTKKRLHKHTFMVYVFYICVKLSLNEDELTYIN